jgi:acetyltransferase-like isoleucine patch superfamily enzyme
MTEFIKGRYTYDDPKILWGEYGDAKASAGAFCSISNTVTIYLGGNHRTDWISTFPFMAWPDKFPTAAGIEGHPASNGDVVIGNDVWIGNNVVIMSGSVIEDGCVIGAHSVVAGRIPAYSVAVGNPARVVRKRFTEEQITDLLTIRWWDWPIEKIMKNIPLLLNPDISRFIEAHKP